MGVWANLATVWHPFFMDIPSFRAAVYPAAAELTKSAPPCAVHTGPAPRCCRAASRRRARKCFASPGALDACIAVLTTAKPGVTPGGARPGVAVRRQALQTARRPR